jgi:hypothetical protein
MAGRIVPRIPSGMDRRLPPITRETETFSTKSITPQTVEARIGLDEPQPAHTMPPRRAEAAAMSLGKTEMSACGSAARVKAHAVIGSVSTEAQSEESSPLREQVKSEALIVFTIVPPTREK